MRRRLNLWSEQLLEGHGTIVHQPVRTLQLRICAQRLWE
jgi:hypothetical protein